MKDIVFIKIIATILIMVGISFMASTDSNNPMPEVGLPVEPSDFNIYSLADRAPQFTVEWVDQPTDDCDPVTLCINLLAVWVGWAFTTLGLVLVWIGNIIIMVVFTLAFMFWNIAKIFVFITWPVFQGHIFLELLGLALTAILGGAVILWFLNHLKSLIPRIG